MQLAKTYVQLTKPGIVCGNLVTTAGGFAMQGHMEISYLLITLLAIASVMGAGCVLNNCIDRAADAKMVRTKHRALVQGNLSVTHAAMFGLLLALLGFSLLLLYTNLLTTLIALFGFSIYPFVYSWMKVRSVYATHVGSLAGAVPPLVGYSAVGNHLDLGALLLFLAVAFWQMPHFFAIAIYRQEDYRRAGIPVFPAVKGIGATKRQMRLYIVAFICAVALLTYGGYTGYVTFVVTSLAGIVWFFLKGGHPEQWARLMFRASLIVITIFSISIFFN